MSTRPAPRPMRKCGLVEPQFDLVCERDLGHSPGHYGSSENGIWEGRWGDGTLHVDRTELARTRLNPEEMLA